MPTGLTQDAGWEIGVSRTIQQPPQAVWEFITGPEGVALWLGAEEREERRTYWKGVMDRVVAELI
ncbi:hypothetical protein ABZ154_07070 [Streptomyces sp. NPDC006261]|uniref:hypothetical protein n=1 Tax=Streptomyces sp. NPDC006261 TaxID=3156739 RepID=UPI0033BAEF45